MDIKKIIENAERYRIPEIFRNAFDLSESKGAVTSTFNKISSVVKHYYKLKPNLIESIKKILHKPYIVSYVIDSLKDGVTKQQVLSKNFKVGKKRYDLYTAKDTFKFIKTFNNIKIVDKIKSIQGTEPVGSEFPGDKSIGDVKFFDNTTVDINTRLERIKALKELSERIASRPVPEVLYIAVSPAEAEQMMEGVNIKGEVIANEQAITYDLKDKYILAIVRNAEKFKPLATHILKTNNYPQQMFTDEFDEWISNLDSMWITKNFNLQYLLYFINLHTDNLYYEGSLKRWNKHGYGSGALEREAVVTDLFDCLPPTDQDEFFCDNKYRVNPGDYNSPITEPITDKFSLEILPTSPFLITEIDRSQNIGYLKRNPDGPTIQTFYRVFRSEKNLRPKSNAYILLTGYKESITENHILDGRILIDIKLPGATGWMSVNKRFERRNFDGSDGQGIFLSYGRFGDSILEVTFEQFNTGLTDYQAVVRITSPDQNLPQISRMSFINWRILGFVPNLPDLGL